MKSNLDQTAASLDEGGRILRSIVRPYPAKTAGIPVKFNYEMNTGQFKFEWAVPSSSSSSSTTATIAPPLDIATHKLTSNETEIFYPAMLAHGRKVIVRGLAAGDEYSYDEARQTLSINALNNSPGARHSIVVSLDPPLSSEFAINTFWGDFGGQIYAVLGALAALGWYLFFL